MSTSTITTDAAASAKPLWMLNSLMVERATAGDTGGAFTVLEQWVTADGNPPPHVHTNEDEAFLVVDGEIEVTVADRTTVVGAGGFAFAPRGLPHTFRVREGVAHLMVIATPGGIEAFFRDLGEPAPRLELPEPAAPDVDHVVNTAARHGITILPPPG